MNSKYRVLFGFLSAILLLPVELEGLSAYIEVGAEKLRNAPSIKIHARTKAAKTTITIAFKLPQPSGVYWHGYLTLIDENDEPLLKTVIRGEDIRRALDEQVLRNWDWMEFKPAEVFRFTVSNKLLENSKFAWELGPRKNDHGVNYGGGFIHWAYLNVLADAGEQSHGATQTE